MSLAVSRNERSSENINQEHLLRLTPHIFDFRRVNLTWVKD